MAEKIGPELRALLQKHYPQAFKGNGNDIVQALAELTDAQSGLIVLAIRQDGVSIAPKIIDLITKRLQAIYKKILKQSQRAKN